MIASLFVKGKPTEATVVCCCELEQREIRRWLTYLCCRSIHCTLIVERRDRSVPLAGRGSILTKIQSLSRRCGRRRIIGDMRESTDHLGCVEGPLGEVGLCESDEWGHGGGSSWRSCEGTLELERVALLLWQSVWELWEPRRWSESLMCRKVSRNSVDQTMKKKDVNWCQLTQNNYVQNKDGLSIYSPNP